MWRPWFYGAASQVEGQAQVAFSPRLRMLTAPRFQRLLGKRSATSRTASKVLLTHFFIVLLALVTDATGAAEVIPPTTSTDAGVQQVAIVGGSYFFRPDHVVVKAGRRLELAVRVEPGIIPHRFVLATVSGRTLADVPINETTKVLRFDLPPGKYVFQCPNQLLFFKSHRERGMAGVLEVKE